MPSKTIVAAIQKRTVPKRMTVANNLKVYRHVLKRPARKLRRLTGFNVFERMRNQGLTLSPSQWVDTHKSICHDWKNMDGDDKLAYNIQAAYEQRNRDKALSIALSLKSGQESSEVLELGQRWKKKTSASRLKLNQAAYSDHSLFTQGHTLRDSKSPLKQSWLDITSTLTDAEILAKLQSDFYADATNAGNIEEKFDRNASALDE